jgi:hypothetical protein
MSYPSSGGYDTNLLARAPSASKAEKQVRPPAPRRAPPLTSPSL